MPFFLCRLPPPPPPAACLLLLPPLQHNPHACRNFNGGFFYLQNTRPDGPVSYLLYEMTDRMLLSTDHDMKWIVTRWGCPHTHFTMNMVRT